MQEHTEQHFDELAKKVMKSSTLEGPSVNFTTDVMNKIEALEKSSATVYKPLISKRSWFVISIIVLAGLGFLIFGEGIESSGILDSVDYGVISDNKVTDFLGSVTFSKILSYGIAFFGLIWMLQITMIKQMLDKRLQF